jgi:hypothetical protein
MKLKLFKESCAPAGSGVLLTWHAAEPSLHTIDLSNASVPAAGSGVLLTWDIAELAPQQSWKVSERALGWDEGEQSDGEDTYIGKL